MAAMIFYGLEKWKSRKDGQWFSMYNVVSIKFLASKKYIYSFSQRSTMWKLYPAVAAIIDFQSIDTKNWHLVDLLPISSALINQQIPL